MPATRTFKGEIRVASRIIDYLSSGLYDSPSACLKELVNNSYDADASRVDIFIKPDADSIIIEDNGTGMTRKEFVRHFGHVSESYKRDGSETTKSGRPKIGKIGIGFIAANELCEVMELASTTEGSTAELNVTIDFKKMREPPETRRRGKTEFAKADYVGREETVQGSKHYTRVVLRDVRGEAQQILASVGRWPSGDDAESLYGLTAESIQAKLADPDLVNWREFDSYSENMLRVGLNVPVPYHNHWAPSSIRSQLRPFATAAARLGFHVFWDGTELRKPIVFRDSGDCLVRRFDYSGTNVGGKGYFFARHGVLRPENLNGVLIRIRNAAIGEFARDFLSFPSTEGTLFQRWISAEIWADDSLEDALNIDRRTMRITHPAYVELQRAIHERLSEVISDVRREIHGARTVVRHRQRAVAEAAAVADIAASSADEIGRATARHLVDEWRAADRDPALERRLIKKYSVSEIYDIVIRVAEETLDPPVLRRFLRALTEELTG